MPVRPAWLLAAPAAALFATACGGDDHHVRPDPQADACEVVSNGANVVVGSGLPGDPAAPEPASGYRLGKTAVESRSYMVVAANPLATRAGCDVLKAGGSAVDAAVAVQAVLGLVEPQSSGLGGGAFMLHYDAATRAVVAYDGRETAPARATADYLRWISADNRVAPIPSARASGRSIGTPGVVRMLELAHREHGELPWNGLFDAGITLARDGFPISGRMADAIAGNAASLRRDPDAAALYLNADGTPRALGSRFLNPDYAQVLQRLASGGADAFYTGEIAQGIVAKIGMSQTADGSPMTPGLTTLADLQNYQAKKREAVCTTYRNYWVCGMPPPSSGGIAVASALGILENFPLGQYGPTAIDGEGGKPSVLGVHLVSEAERLAYADRDKYIADTDFVPLPGGNWQTLLNRPYLASRAALIDTGRSMGTAQAGDLGAVPLGVDRTPENGTTHVSIVDRQGNAVALTTTVEGSMGSYHVTQGFILNNQLTDFSAQPTDANGTPMANRVAPGKRPRSSMAPTLVFRSGPDGSRGEFLMATGSPGGGTIIQYVVKTIVGVVDWGLDAQQATSLVDFGASNSPTTSVGGEHPNIDARDGGANDPLVQGLKALGHTVSVNAQSSGIGTIVRRYVDGLPRLQGGADPRREGIVLGDTVR